MKNLILIFAGIVLLPMYSMASDTMPLAAGICVNKASVLMEQEKFAKAVEVLKTFQAKQNKTDKKKAARKGYDHYYIDFLLGHCFLMLDKTDLPGSSSVQYIKKAAQAYENAVKKKPDFSAAWLNLAKCLYDLGEMKKAGQAFLKGYETGKDKKPVNLFYASMCYSFVNDYQKALEIFNRLLSMHPDKIRLEWKESLVNILFSLEKYKQALPWIKELTRKTKGRKKKKWQEILLYQYLNLEMDKKALEYAKYLTETDPGEPKWWKGLTHIYLNENKLEKGLAALVIYSFIAPLTQEETSLLADLYLACNIPLKGADILSKWLETQGNDSTPEQITKIAQAYLMGFQEDNALAWIEKGLAGKKDPDLLKLKADILSRQRKSALKALKHLEKTGHQAGSSKLKAPQ